MTRTDTHRPSTLDPAEYTWLGEWWDGPEDSSSAFDPIGDVVGIGSRCRPDGHFVTDGHCDHCGTGHVLYNCIAYLHDPTGDVIVVGPHCAETVGLPDLGAKDRKQRQADHKLAARREARSHFETEPGVPEALAYARRQSGEFFHDLLEKLDTYGPWSPNQLAAVLRAKDRDARRQEEDPDPDPTPVVEGRIVITGKVLTTRWQDSQYGDVHKCLVLDDRGFKVWGSVPQSIDHSWVRNGWPSTTTAAEHAAHETGLIAEGYAVTRRNSDGIWEAAERPELERGTWVTFTATVERSDRDETFGFYKRPAKATRIV